VTGADGIIGRAVTDALVAEGIAVTGLSQSWDGPTRADRPVTGDATDEADIAAALEGADAVIHLAAIAHPDKAPPYKVYRTNTDATFNVLCQAGGRGIGRAVIASSINAFGVPMNQHQVLPAYFPIDEDIPARIDDWYSLSKRSDELTAEMAASHWGMSVVALRFPHVADADGLRDHARQAARDPAPLVREGWSYLDVRDAARVTLAALTAPLTAPPDGPPGQALVVGVAAGDTLLDEDSAALLDRYAPEVERRGPLTGRVSLIDTSRARSALGFTPRHSVHTAYSIDSPGGAEHGPGPSGGRS
jgi:nucleoside-diphosphate-sugar epimerase